MKRNKKFYLLAQTSISKSSSSRLDLSPRSCLPLFPNTSAATKPQTRSDRRKRSGAAPEGESMSFARRSQKWQASAWTGKARSDKVREWSMSHVYRANT